MSDLKRKRSPLALQAGPAFKKPTLFGHSPAGADELEEGELGPEDDDGVQPRELPAPPATKNPSFILHPSSLPPKPSPLTSSYAFKYSQSPMNSRPHHDAEDCRSLIGQLLSWDVSPEYIISRGVNKELVARSLFELGFEIPPHFVHLVPRHHPHLQSLRPVPQHPVSLPEQPPTASENEPPVNGDARPFPEAEPQEPQRPPTPPANHFAELEASRREQLMARKRKVAVARSRDIHSEIEGLFAAAQSDLMTIDAVEDPAQSSDVSMSPPHAEQAEVSNHIAEVRQTAEAAAELAPDEVEYFHEEPPISRQSSISALSVMTQAPTTSEATPATGPFTPAPYSARPSRPKATDFESDPSHALPQHLKRATSGIFVPDMARQTRVIIDLSDDEDTDPAPEIDDERKRNLLQTEQKLNALKARLAAMEAKKRAPSKTNKPNIPSASIRHTEVADETPTTTTANSDTERCLEDTKEEVEQLEDARRELINHEEPTAPVPEKSDIDEAETSHSSNSSESEDDTATTSADVDMRKADRPAPIVGSESDPTALQVSVDELPSELQTLVHFSAYSSLTSCYPSITGSPLPLLRRYALALNNFTTSKRALDPERFFCQFEADGGTCADPKCGRSHWSSYMPSDNDLHDFIDVVYADQRLPPHWSKDKVQVFRRGLTAVTSGLDRTASHIPFDRVDVVLARLQDFFRRF